MHYLFTLLFSCAILTTPLPPAEQSLSTQLDKKLHSGGMQIMQHREFGKLYGYSTWIARDKQRLKAKYFAHKTSNASVYNRYRRWAAGKQVAMISSGAFTAGDYKTPVGLTVDNGRVVNRRIKLDEMDALTIVYPTGGIAVADLDNMNLNIRYSDTGKKYTIDSRRNIGRLLDWATEEKATIFQTQLLIYDNELRLKRVRSGRASHYRKRRALILCRFKGKLYHVIFYAKKKVSLHSFARDVLQAFHEESGIDVISMINLDTGMFDFQEVYDERGRMIPRYTGEEDKTTATNLIAYYYE